MTLHAMPVLTAKRLAATDLADLLATSQSLRDARSQAAELLDAARREAATLLDSARRGVTVERTEAEQQIQDHRARVLKETQAEISAIRLADTMDVAGQLTERFDALTPWIGDLILGTLVRLVGAIDPDDRMRRILDQALTTSRRDWNLRLRCHPQDAPLLQTLVDLDRVGEHRFRAVTDFVTDDSLAPGGCLLESEGGLVGIGIEAQIDALRQAIGLADPARPNDDSDVGEGDEA